MSSVEDANFLAALPASTITASAGESLAVVLLVKTLPV